MKHNSFKSAQHSANYSNLQIKKANRKQPVKVFSEEEKKALALQYGVGTVPSKAPMVGTINKVEKPVDLSVLPTELLKTLGLK